MSLARDEVEQRKSIVTGDTRARSRALSREVSMKRIVRDRMDKKKGMCNLLIIHRAVRSF